MTKSMLFSDNKTSNWSVYQAQDVEMMESTTYGVQTLIKHGAEVNKLSVYTFTPFTPQRVAVILMWSGILLINQTLALLLTSMNILKRLDFLSSLVDPCAKLPRARVETQERIPLSHALTSTKGNPGLDFSWCGHQLVLLHASYQSGILVAISS